MPTFSVIACFATRKHFLQEDLGNFKGEVSSNRSQDAILSCAELAFDKGYKFFVLGFNGICRSGPSALAEYPKLTPAKDTDCPNGIGKYRRGAVYTFGKLIIAMVRGGTNRWVIGYDLRMVDSKKKKRKKKKTGEDLFSVHIRKISDVSLSSFLRLKY